MSFRTTSKSGARPNNRLLQAMSPEAFSKFKPHLRLLDLPTKRVLVEPDQPTTEVFFMASGLASIVAQNSEERVEIAHVGREGMTGQHLLLFAETTPNNTFIQTAGEGYSMSATTMLEIYARDPEIRSLFLRYLQTCELQLAHSALANARYSVLERLARWLLMVHDRLDGDDLPLTHEFLALMLGVRRSGVTDQIHIMEGNHAIKATRANIRVLDRDKLTQTAGESYGIPEAEYERLIGLQLNHHGRLLHGSEQQAVARPLH